jgi:hypothetical protein
LFAVFVASLTSTSAHAQSAGARADALFRDGKELLAAGKTLEACAAFDASQKAAPSLSTKLHQANCREKAGQLATAWSLFSSVVRESAAASDDFSRQLQGIAAKREAALRPRLSTLTVAVMPPSEGLEVRVNGVVLRSSDWNNAVPVDGGRYTITAQAPHREPWFSRIVVPAERGAESVLVPSLVPANEPGAEIPTTKSASGSWKSDWTGHALVAGGVVLSGVGLFVLLDARSTIEAHNSASTYQQAFDGRDAAASARTYESVAAVAMIAGGGLIVGGLVHYALRRPATEPAVSAQLSNGAASFVITGSF